MDRVLEAERERLKADFGAVTGTEFEHFFCPMLFRDEPAELCRAHVVNQAFSSADGAWTVQRRDVDSFFGSRFEADFVELRNKGKTPDHFVDAPAGGRTRAEFSLRGQKIDHFVAKGPVPQKFTEVRFAGPRGEVRLGLKISPSELSKTGPTDWKIELGSDLRIPALVSLMKAAHLTMFRMLGYRYALSPGGHLLGRQVLGTFAERFMNARRSEAVESARDYFREFAVMVRPLEKAVPDLRGTAVDGKLLLCPGAAGIWAAIVIVNIGNSSHGVLVPVYENPEGGERFVSFLKDGPERVPVHFARYQSDSWACSPSEITLTWPRSGVLYPE